MDLSICLAKTLNCHQILPLQTYPLYTETMLEFLVHMLDDISLVAIIAGNIFSIAQPYREVQILYLKNVFRTVLNKDDICK